MEMSFAVGLVTIPVILFAFLLPIALLVALQVWLCKKSVYLGLILPGISLALSLLLTLSMTAFSTLTFTGGNTLVTVEGGGAQEEPIEAPVREKTELHPRTLLAAGGVFLVTNIPTIVFGGIWLHCKGRQETLDDLNRMRIEDLE